MNLSGRKRTCNTCKEILPIEDFYVVGKLVNGEERRRFTCARCYNSRNKKVKRALKHRAIEYLGGKCSHCGQKFDIDDVYDFHHMDPITKESDISRLISDNSRFENIKDELDKCVLLCANCHRIYHSYAD